MWAVNAQENPLRNTLRYIQLYIELEPFDNLHIGLDYVLQTYSLSF